MVVTAAFSMFAVQHHLSIPQGVLSTETALEIEILQIVSK
jgi:hypothetical protein